MHRAAASDAGAARGIPFADALRFWVKLGFISFGGPAGQIAILHREVVERRRWISETRFLHALNYCMLLPGPEAQQLATYVGWLLHRTRGALAAGVLFVLPSVLILLGLSWVYATFGALPAVAGVLDGFKAVVVALVVEAVLRIGRRAIRGVVQLLLAAAAFVAIYFGGIAFPWIVLAGAAIGCAGAKLWPAAWIPRGDGNTPAGAAGARSAAGSPKPWLDDDTPAPEHTLPSRSRALRILAVGGVLWALPCALLAAVLGWNSVPLQQYRFFTVAALVTFGGAYAVLAYVSQAAVHAYAWITAAQALDGLALAETTPGPLIMVLQFVGFMTGWNHPGPLAPLTAAVIGSLVTTWVTFLPSFVFILVGGPYVEVLRRSPALGGALSGVTAVVLGVILNLALVFGAAVILPHGTAGGVGWFAVAVAAIALLALRRYEIDAAWVVLGGGLAGLARLTWAG